MKGEGSKKGLGRGYEGRLERMTKKEWGGVERGGMEGEKRKREEQKKGSRVFLPHGLKGRWKD